MLEESRVSEGQLYISYLLDAEVSRVYQAWSDPEQLSQWMGPGTVSCESVESDLRIGGRYCINMKTEDGIKTAFGEYREIDPNRKLAFTWQWEDGSFTDSLVTLKFEEWDGRTRLILEHNALPDQEVAEHHTQGWTGSLNKLEDYLA